MQPVTRRGLTGFTLMQIHVMVGALPLLIARLNAVVVHQIFKCSLKVEKHKDFMILKSVPWNRG